MKLLCAAVHGSDVGPSRRVQRLTTSVAIGGIADIGWPAAGSIQSRLTLAV
jgi:hypothetical protein